MVTTMKRTVAALERINVELEEMLTAHRVVRATLPFGLDILEVIAPLDIPEIGVLVGQTFWLAGSSFDGYCYPITANGLEVYCPCQQYEHRHGQCKHTKRLSDLQYAAYQHHQKLHDASVISAQVLHEPAVETRSHVEDELGYAFDAKPSPVSNAYCDGCGRLSRQAMCAWCLGVAA